MRIITDAELVDMEFGTGAVKITPAHDSNDYAASLRHGLDSINILNNDGTINDAGGQFEGQPRFKVCMRLCLPRSQVRSIARGVDNFRGTWKYRRQDVKQLFYEELLLFLKAATYGDSSHDCASQLGVI